MTIRKVLTFFIFFIFAVAAMSGATAWAQFGGFDDGGEDILTVRTLVSLEEAAPGDTLWLAVRLSLAEGWHINSARPLQDYLIPTELEVHPKAGFRVGEIVYPDGKTIPLLGEQMSVYTSGMAILVPLVIDPGTAFGPVDVQGVLHYQGCNDKSCAPPAEKELTWHFQVAGERGPAQYPEIFAAVVGSTSGTSAIKQSVASSAPSNDLERLVKEHGTWGYLLALLVAFGTGLLLSFSPCTYPMIPITVSIFAGQARGMGRGFVLSLFYVVTMALIYGAMGAVVASVGGVFGAWLAHPVVVGIIVTIFVVFALSMFGLYELQVPAGLRNRMAGKGGTGIGGAIVLGAVAALVVSPCVGPFVAGIMLYIATTGSAFLGFVILFTFALGLGTLFVIIGTFSSAIQALPNAGVWMESVKKFFGFVLLLMALYFLRPLVPMELIALLAGLLLLGAGVFGGGFDRLAADASFFPRLKKLFGVVSTLLGIYLLAGYLVSSGFIWPPVTIKAPVVGGGMGAPAMEEIPWRTDLDRGLEEARRLGRPVVIDTWATWCANCKKLDRITWSDPDITRETRRFVPLKIQLEKNDTPQTRHFMKRFGLKVYSLPTIILIDSHGQVQEIIQGFLGPEKMLKHLEAVS